MSDEIPADAVLPDSSAWVDYFRGRPGPGGTGMRQLFAGEKAVLCHPVRAEIVPFISEGEKGDRARLDLALLRILEDPPDLWDRVIDYQRMLLRHGAQGSVMDLMVVAVASFHRVQVFSVDGDFARHARFLPLKLWGPA